jgi:hypothetical protein
MTRTPVDLIVALERECLKVDEAIAKRAWDACEASWRAQRLLTHELDIALVEHPLTDVESAAVRKRIDRLTRYREAQLKRLKAFNESCAKRLTNVGRFRSFAKSVGQDRRSSLLDVTQ